MNNQSKLFRKCQEEADNAIYEELLVNNKCLVKMFCGTGKSLIMRYGKSFVNKKLCVYVFPSLALITQFNDDYLNETFPKNDILNVSSENGSTTDPEEIVKFLKKKKNKIICVTYQSFGTLLDNLGNNKINICCYDEAHHAVGEVSQKLIFQNEVCEKQVFFTATPKNANGIVMYDRNDIDSGMCGKLVYDYTYLNGLNDGWLNPIEIRIDMYMEDTNKSVYESIARAVILSGNNRVLTFHSEVSSESSMVTAVQRFVDDEKFRIAFNDVLVNEFPEKVGFYKKIQMIGLYSEICNKDRAEILGNFDVCPDNEVFIISSCETIGEGVDTKKANMCVFVDPKQSFVKIIQNIGRVVRKHCGSINASTILIPCWVDKMKYQDCGGDREKCDAVIREDMGQTGNFNGILNVLSALKQEDEDIYDICLSYPDTFSPQEINNHFNKHGYTIDEKIGDGYMEETIEYLLDDELDYELYDDCDTDEDRIMNIAIDHNVCIEINNNSLENPVEIYNRECEETIRMFRDIDEDTDEIVYKPMVQIESKSKKDTNKIPKINTNNRPRIQVHTNPDVKVLWNISGDIDMTRDVCSCIIDCEVVGYDAFEIWKNNLITVKDYIDVNKKIPSKHDKHTEIKSLNYWITNQKTNYNENITLCKNCMKKPERYQLWTEFINDPKYKEYFIDNIEIWKNNLILVKEYIDFNNKRPIKTDKNKEIKSLGEWISHQKENYNSDITLCKQIMKTHEIHQLWTEFINDPKYKEYFIDYNETWKHNLLKLKEYIDDNNKLPTNRVGNSDETNSLSNWNSSQKSKYNPDITLCKERMKTHEIHQLWTEFINDPKYKEYFIDNIEIWKNQLILVKEYIDANKILPSRSVKKNEFQTLGNWINTQKNIYDQDITLCKQIMQTPEIHQLWTEFINDAKYKEYLCDLNEKWKNKLILVKEYIDVNNKSPSPHDKNKEIKSLGSWISTQKKNYDPDIKLCKECMKFPQIHQMWAEFINDPKYNEYFIDNIEIWKNKLVSVKEYIDFNNKSPSSSDKNTEIKLLGNWISSQKSKYNPDINLCKECMKTPEIHQLWTDFINNQKHKEYFIDNNEIWKNKLLLVKEYIDANKILPSRSDKNNDVRTLGNWISCKKKNYDPDITLCKECMKIPEIHKMWTEFINDTKYNEYFIDNIEIWKNKLLLVKEYIDVNKKRPSSTDKNKEIKSLVSWISIQKQHYNSDITLCKECMKTPEIHQLWSEFINDPTYKEYFIDNNEIWKNKLLLVKEYIDTNNKRPSDHSKNTEIKSLGYWISDQKKNYDQDISKCKYGMQIPEIHQLWTEFINDPKYKEYFILKPAKKSMKLNLIQKPIEPVEVVEDIETKKQRILSEHSELLQKYKRMNSETLNKHFAENPEEWVKYHEISEKNEETFPENGIPRNRIIEELEKIKTKRKKIVVDMGCGKGQISQHFIDKNDQRFVFKNYDHIAFNNTVEVCDISKTPEDDNSVEIAILSLAMWGSNCNSYITEAYRILESGCKLYIIEPTSRKRWTDECGEPADKLIKLLEENGFRIINSSIEKFCMFECIKL